MATIQRDIKGGTAKAVVMTRAPNAAANPVFLIILVLVALLTQAVWLPAT